MPFVRTPHHLPVSSELLDDFPKGMRLGPSLLASGSTRVLCHLIETLDGNASDPPGVTLRWSGSDVRYALGIRTAHDGGLSRGITP